MLNVIVPLAGTGSRFLREGYARPKPFVKAWGKEIILWLIENLALQSTDVLVFVYNSKPELGMSLKPFFRIVEDHFVSASRSERPEVNYVCLDKPTVGAAETVLQGIKSLPSNRLNLPSVLLDGDTFYNVDVLTIFRELSQERDTKNHSILNGGAVIVFDDDKPDENPYSYVKTGFPADSIKHIKEKNKEGMSGLACSGCYYFHHTLTLMTEIMGAVELHSQIADSLVVQKELYTSSVISKMLEKGGNFKAIKLETTEFHVVGTPTQLGSFITAADVATQQSKKRFCFDLDNTLVTSPAVPGNYATCKPILRVIDYLQKLHADGHYIIVYTARRMRTHDANIGRVVADVAAITIQQLSDFAIPYNELVFGKPFADFYIDDKAILPFLDDLHKETGIIL